MPLTPAEQAELDALDGYFAAEDERKKGQAQSDAFRQEARRGRPPAKPRPFSLYRTLVGGARDAVQGALDTVDAVGDWAGRSTGIGGVMLGSSASNGIAEYVSWDELNRRGGDAVFGQDGVGSAQLAQPEGSENAGTAERVARSITSFVIPFTAAMKATTALRTFGVLGRMGQGLVAGAAVDFTQVDPVAGNMANVLRDTFGLDNAMLDSLAAEEDDDALMTRFKAAAAGAPLGLVGDAVFETGGRLLKMYRAWKGTADEAAATVASIRAGAVKLTPTKARKAAADAAGEVPVVEADEVIAPAAGEAERFVYDLRPAGPEDFDDVLDFLKSKAGELEVDPETLGRFAQNLADGDPENVLAKLGIDPAKLDFTKYDDPAMLGRLQRGLAELYEGLASRLGRSNRVVGEKTIVRGAEALASTPQVLRSLYGSTSGLAEEITAGRMIVGAHAHRLLADAQAALKEIADGGDGSAWAAFLSSFHRHAYYMGAVRGAGSEIGRALRSLQMLVKVDPSQAAKMLDDANVADTVAAQVGARKFTIQDGASAFADTLKTDAEKIAALQKLLASGGDVAELSRGVREGAGSTLKRMSDAIRETVGSLFGAATATYNALSGLGFLAMNGLGKGLAAMVRTPALMLGGEAGLQARRAWLEVWAYHEGVLGGFREAYNNTLHVFERELFSEGAINLDGLGLNQLAKGAQLRSARAGVKLTGQPMERVDVVNHKAFSLTTSERQSLKKLASELPGPKFFQAGLRGLVNTAGAAINAAGSAYRMGTSIFINLPDEFVGTLATRAGAYAKSVQLATAEAAELGLEGKGISEYIKARTVQLFGEGPRGWSTDGIDGGAQVALARAGEVEAKMVLFQDELEWTFSRQTARWINQAGGLGSIIIPFIRTPLRIIERTVIDNTPLGLFKGRIRKAIAAGGPQRDEALARMALSMMAVATAFELAEDRVIVGKDGGNLSTARDAGRPSYSIRLGDDAYEFSRLDPIGTLLGVGADLRESLDAAGDDPEAGTAAAEVFEAMVWATAANVLSKSWLTSLRNLTDLAGATSEDDVGLRKDQFLRGLATRFVPAAGVQKTIEGWDNGAMREAVGFSDGLLASTLGADKLPVRRTFLGREQTLSGMSRIAGVRGDVMPADNEDPVMAEMERLSFREPASARRQKGVKLNAAQFSRFLELRGQVVRDPSTGLTMEEALTALVKLPEYQGLPKAARIAEVRNVTKGYSALAAEALTDEDQSYALARLRVELFDTAAMEGWQPERREAELNHFAQQLGLQP